MTPFHNEQHWQDFCAWVASAGPEKARQLMADYIEEHWADFTAYLHTRHAFDSARKP